MAHLEDFGDGHHRQAASVGSADRVVPLSAKLFGNPFQLVFTLRVAIGKGSQAGTSLGCVALRTGDAKIVASVFANRLA